LKLGSGPRVSRLKSLHKNSLIFLCPSREAVHFLEDGTGGEGSGVKAPGLLEEVRPSRPRCVQADLNRCALCEDLRAVDSLIRGYKGIQGGFEEQWISGAGSAKESGILQRRHQGCRALARARRSLPSYFGPEWCVELAPTSPEFGEGGPSEGHVNPSTLPCPYPGGDLVIQPSLAVDLVDVPIGAPEVRPFGTLQMLDRPDEFYA
jgi:hypothetical protein